MIDEKILARALRAAANGALAPYTPTIPKGFVGSFSYEQPPGIKDAELLASMLNALADVFEKAGEL